MLDVMPRATRGPVLDVEGALVRALRLQLDLSLMELGNKLGKEKGTVQRWEKGHLDDLTWIGVLVKLSLPVDWTPDPDVLARARAEIARLKKPPRSTKPI